MVSSQNGEFLTEWISEIAISKRSNVCTRRTLPYYPFPIVFLLWLGPWSDLYDESSILLPGMHIIILVEIIASILFIAGLGFYNYLERITVGLPLSSDKGTHSSYSTLKQFQL